MVNVRETFNGKHRHRNDGNMGDFYGITKEYIPSGGFDFRLEFTRRPFVVLK